MSNTLLPCPCCGYEAVQESMEVRKGWESDIHCNGCLLSMHTITYDTEEQAIAACTAAWNRRADARQLALKTRVCPMCEDCPDGCPVETPKDSRNIITNADRIRKTTDEELARFLWEQNGGNRYWKSVEKYLDWLQKEVTYER